jgi:hypothetical protein
MADRDSSRRTRRSGRLGGNRPRTHPKGAQGSPQCKPVQVSAPPAIKSTKVLPVLANIRARLGIAMAAATVTSLALKHQNAERDVDAAHLLQRSVVDEISRQVERLDHILKAARVIGGDLWMPREGS